jgi:hypothetical protein
MNPCQSVPGTVGVGRDVVVDVVVGVVGVVVGGVDAVTVSVLVEIGGVVGVVVVLAATVLSSSAGMSRKPRRIASASTSTPATVAPMTSGEAHGDFGGGVG